MRHIIIFILTTLTFASCDCIQQATGVVLDRKTLKPISRVSLGKFEKEDTSNSYSKRVYTDDNGQFDYHSTSGGISGCPDLILFFYKIGFKTSKIAFSSSSLGDTVYLDRVTLNRDSSITISLSDFNKEIEYCIGVLKTKKLIDITDEQHIQIMYCLNTIFVRQFKGGHYAELQNLADTKNYSRDIITVYKDWELNRGMGYYFPKLKMELLGTPSLYAVYTVTK